jgi:predicted DNA-binding transcriptional regulator YafY
MIASHGPILRILTIHRLIQDRRHPNVPGLARLLGVSRRTVQRDLDVLREEMRAPLVWNPIERGFEYTKDGFVLPDVEMSEGEILALLVASTTLPVVAETPAEPLLRGLIEKAGRAMTETRTFSPEALALGARPLGGSGFARLHASPGVVSAIEAALESRTTLRIRLGSRTGDDRSAHEVDPYFLVSLDGESHLVAYSHRARRVRAFRVERIRAARATSRRFEPPETTVEELLPAILPMRDGSRMFDAVLAIDPSLAAPALERDWGPTAKVQMRTDGGLELSIRTDNADAVARWSFAWGPNAEVVAPPWVRRRARQLIAQIARRYELPVPRAKSRSQRRRPSEAARPASPD